MNRISAAPYPHILRQHVGDASFLWSQWQRMSTHHAVDRYATHSLERRLRANLAALMLDQAKSWEMAQEAVKQYGDAGEYFVAGWLALQRSDDQHVQTLFADARDADASITGVFSALGWLEPGQLQLKLPGWANSGDIIAQLLAVEGCRAIKFDPGLRLDTWLISSDPRVRRSAAILSGEQGRQGQLGVLAELSSDSDRHVELAALLSLVLLGARGDAIANLIMHAAAYPKDAELPTSLAFLATSDVDRRNFIRELWQKGLKWQATRLAGLVKGPEVDSWLLSQMLIPELIVPAGLSFVDRYQLEAEATELFTLDLADLSDDIASQLSDIPDEPYPIRYRIAAWLENQAFVQERELFRSNRLRMFSRLDRALKSDNVPLARWDLPEIPIL